jgi:hypothetical protein
MDELLSPCSSSHVGYPVIEFASCDVPEKWLLDDVVAMAKNEGYEDGDDLWPAVGTLSPHSELFAPQPAPQPALPQHHQQQQQQGPIVTAPAQSPGTKRRGRKPGTRRADGPSVNHVEAERQRREKLNRRFCDLRAAVPTVSRMDKASLLADAATYIAELRARVAQLEAESKRFATARWEPVAVSCGTQLGVGGDDETVVEVRILGPDAAAVRATSAGTHAAARLMGALRSLELHVQHACVTRVHGLTVQDVVVDVPAPLQDDDLRAAVLRVLQQGSAA